jgi:hypothetical protein
LNGVGKVCTEWGYYVVAPPKENPSLVPRVIDLAYSSKICEAAFPPGKHASEFDIVVLFPSPLLLKFGMKQGVPLQPNVTLVNQWGDFDLAFDRLAYVDGDSDPWRYATPHHPLLKERPDTVERPFKLIQVSSYCCRRVRRNETETHWPVGWRPSLG